LGEFATAEIAGVNATVFPLVLGVDGIDLAWPNGFGVPIRCGSALTPNRVYGLAPIIRFIIRRDVDYTGAIAASVKRFKFFSN
jgi:hypothetical protein